MNPGTLTGLEGENLQPQSRGKQEKKNWRLGEWVGRKTNDFKKGTTNANANNRKKGNREAFSYSRRRGGADIHATVSP